MEKVEEKEVLISDFEKSTLSKFSAKRLQRARKKGIQIGVEIPPLKSEVTYPQKPRFLFIISSIFLVLASILTLVLGGYFSVVALFAVIISGISNSPALNIEFFNLLYASSNVFFALVMLGLLVLTLTVFYLFLKASITSLNYAFAPRQEIALGRKTTSSIIISLAIGVLATFFAIYFMVSETNLDVYVYIALIVVAIAMFLYGGFVIYYSAKEKKWVGTAFDEQQKLDFKNHFDSIARIENRKKTSGLKKDVSKSKNKFLSLIYNMLVDFAVITDIYNNIKSIELSRKKSNYIGKQGILQSLLFLILISSGIGFVGSAFTTFDKSFIFGLLFLVLGIVFCIVSLTRLPLAFYCSILQIKLERKAIGIFSLILSILIVLFIVIGFIILI